MKKRLIQSLFTIIIAVIILTTFASYMFRSGSVFSPTENRYLASRPQMTLSGLADGSFMDSFELYVKEQLPLRDSLIMLKALTGQAMLKNENNGIALGKDGYLFEKLVSTGGQIDKNRAAIINFAKNTDRDINVCIIPNSCEILKDKRPAGFPGISQKDETDKLYSGLTSLHNVNTIDMSDILNRHREEYIYYKTDHHWTSLGAYYGYLSLCEGMGLDVVDITEIDNIKKDVPGFFGTYYSKFRGAGVSPDILTYYDVPVKYFETGGRVYDSMYDKEKLDTYDKYAMFMHGNEGLTVIETGEDKRERRGELIMFKDSYSNCLIPFLTYDYDRLMIVDLRYYPDGVGDLLDEHRDADILLIYNFMHFNEDNHFYRLTT